jgi:hypothetical protein
MKGRADVANFALRAFLTKVGHRYDELRGLAPFRPTKNQWFEVVAFFEGACCYCGAALKNDDSTKDHLIPLNKRSLGLHAWGNVVPSCRACNAAKHHGGYEPFLRSRCSETDYASRCANLRKFQEVYRYQPTLALLEIANNLYEDVGTVAMALVDLRYKQADKVLKGMLGKDGA